MSQTVFRDATVVLGVDPEAGTRLLFALMKDNTLAIAYPLESGAIERIAPLSEVETYLNSRPKDEFSRVVLEEIEKLKTVTGG